jgi:hypothetical protein
LESVGGGLELLPLPVKRGNEYAVFVNDVGKVLALSVAGELVELVDDLGEGCEDELLAHGGQVVAR